jgi:hypothetical protein
MLTDYGESCYNEISGEFSLGGGDAFKNKKETAVAGAMMSGDDDALVDALGAFDIYAYTAYSVAGSYINGDGSYSAALSGLQGVSSAGTVTITGLFDKLITGGVGCPNCGRIANTFNQFRDWLNNNFTASGRNTISETQAGAEYIHYGYAGQVDSFKKGLREGGYATPNTDIMSPNAAKQILGLPHNVPPDAYYIVRPGVGTQILGPRMVFPITAPLRIGLFGQEVVFPNGTGPGTVYGPYPLP